MKIPFVCAGGSLPRTAGIAVAAMLLSSACATKKHVQNQIAPLNASISAVEAKANSNSKAINDLDERVRREVGRLDESDQGIEGQARNAAAEARSAGELAASARGEAQNARSLAERGLAGLDRLQENLGNYVFLGEETIYFNRGKSALSEEGKKSIGRLIEKIDGDLFVFEVLGYTDSTGSATLNLELSRKRAASVVRELVSQHKIPLRHIHDLGLGKDDPAAENRTAAGRKQNRRVEIKLYALDVKEEGAQPSKVSQAR